MQGSSNITGRASILSPKLAAALLLSKHTPGQFSPQSSVTSDDDNNNASKAIAL